MTGHGKHMHVIRRLDHGMAKSQKQLSSGTLVSAAHQMPGHFLQRCVHWMETSLRIRSGTQPACCTYFSCRHSPQVTTCLPKAVLETGLPVGAWAAAAPLGCTAALGPVTGAGRTFATFARANGLGNQTCVLARRWNVHVLHARAREASGVHTRASSADQSCEAECRSCARLNCLRGNEDQFAQVGATTDAHFCQYGHDSARQPIYAACWLGCSRTH